MKWFITIFFAAVISLLVWVGSQAHGAFFGFRIICWAAAGAVALIGIVICVVTHLDWR